MSKILVNFANIYSEEYEFESDDRTFEDLSKEIDECEKDNSKSQHISPSIIKYFDDDGNKIDNHKKLIKDYKKINVELDIKYPCIVMIGESGVGKSAVCNLISHSHEFPVSEKTSSYTSQTTIRQVQWHDRVPISIEDEETEGKLENTNQQENDSQTFTLLDTPGLADSNSQDTKHIKNMVLRCKLVNKVTAFVIVFNGEHPRLTESLKIMLNTFKEMFGDDYFKSVALMFTRWGHNKIAISKRKKSNICAPNKQTEYEQYLKQIGMNECRSLPCFFIDTCPYDHDEAIKIYEELKKFHQSVFSWQEFSCDRFRSVKSFRDQIIEQKEKALLQQQLEYQQKLLLEEEKKKGERKLKEIQDEKLALLINIEEIKSYKNELEQLLKNERSPETIRERTIEYMQMQTGWSREICLKEFEKRGGSCLGENTKINVSRNGKKLSLLMKDAQIGDEVESCSNLSDFIYYIHTKSNNNMKTIDITYTVENTNKMQTISLTDHHLLFDQNGKLKRADELIIGDYLSAKNEDEITRARIIQITYSRQRVLSFVTYSGEFFAQNIRVSCYAGSENYANVMHKLCVIPRVLYPISKGFCKSVCDFASNYLSPNQLKL